LKLRFTVLPSLSGAFSAAHHWLAILLILCLAACSGLLPSLQTENQPLQDTRTALSIQQTQVETHIQTGTAQSASLTPTVQELHATHTASNATPTIQSTTAPPTPFLTATFSPADFEELISTMSSARILLYEDMAGRRDVNRYVKDTLDRMRLPYVDCGDAIGRLKNELTSQASGTKWDLIIIASESKPGISGEFFEYVNEALDRGSAVILEVQNLDQVANGVAKTLLSRCGIEFARNWVNVPPDQRVMFPLQPTNPILNQPNSGLSFTKVNDYWWDSQDGAEYDIGDWMVLSPGSRAQLVIGVLTGQEKAYGTVTVCVENRFILQTFSSHQLAFNAMEPLWENYIFNALKVSLKLDP
jgi:hypothetical protein